MNFSLIYPILKNNMFRNLGFPRETPRLINFVLTYKCNSRCKICNIWKKNIENDEFTLEEFEKFIKNNKIWWIAYTGGEPFLRKDILEIWKIANMNFSITTNGILTKKIIKTVHEYLTFSDKNININISIDGDEKTHNFIRGLNCFKFAMKTFNKLTKLKQRYDNLNVFLSVTISKFNQDIIFNLIKNNPDKDFIIRPATYSNYYNIKGNDPRPDDNKMIENLKSLEKLNNIKTDRVLIKVWKNYFNAPRQITKCYSGWSSIWINPNWDVFPCINRENFKIGNLRDVDFKIKKLWFNDKIKKHREFAKKCHCASDCEMINSIRYNWKYLFMQKVKI